MTIPTPTISNLEDLSDEDLVLAARVPQTKERAYEILYDRTAPIRLKAGFKAGGYSPEDSAANSTTGLIKAVESYDPSKGAKFSTYANRWIRRYAENRAYALQPLWDQKDPNAKRRGKDPKVISMVTTGVLSEDSTEFGGVSLDDNLDITLDVRGALDQLEETEREMVVRRLLNRETEREIAKSLNLAEEIVSEITQAGLRKLKVTLKGYDS